MTASVQITYKIPVKNFASTLEKIEALNKRAAKFGHAPVSVRKLREFTETVHDESLGIDYLAKFVEVALDGEGPKWDVWTFIAKLEPVVGGGEELLVKSAAGQECPEEYFTSDLHCDHCHTKRKRSAVYVVQHEKEGYKQIGKNCVASYLGHGNPAEILAMAEQVCSAGHILSGGGAPSEEKVIPLHRYVAVVAALMRLEGWVSRSVDMGRSTASVAWNVCWETSKAGVDAMLGYDFQVTPQDIERAERAIAWAEALDLHQRSSYLHDLGVCCRTGLVQLKTSGFVASVVVSYEKTLQREERKPSEHVGAVGQRSVFTNLKVVGLIPVNGMFPKTLVRFYDEQGNSLVWWASGSIDWLSLNETVTLKATVKEHSLYKDIKQTVILRPQKVEAPVEVCENA